MFQVFAVVNSWECSCVSRMTVMTELFPVRELLCLLLHLAPTTANNYCPLFKLKLSLKINQNSYSLVELEPSQFCRRVHDFPPLLCPWFSSSSQLLSPASDYPDFCIPRALSTPGHFSLPLGFNSSLY